MADLRRAYEPFNEKLDPRHHKWQNEDYTDKFIPNIDGYITDFIYATRGREITSLYGIWASLFLISSVVGRDAWFTPPNGDPWLDKDFLNFYLLVLGPAGSGKSSTITVIQKIMSACNKVFREHDDPWMRRKESCEISDVSTPEAFLTSLARHSKTDDQTARRTIVGSQDGKAVEMKANSNGIVMASEFASLLNKKNYNESMSTNLLTLYDCPSLFKWNTVKRGNVFIPDVHLNIVGASTADGMANSVDPTVMQDGFMSRVIMCYVKDYPRQRPFRFQTQCSMKDLIRRLLWIARHKKGGFHLSKNAEKRFEQWYERFMNSMNRNPDKAGYLIRNRVLALKIAVLLKMSEYTTGNEVETRHLDAAFKLIAQTYKQSADLVEYFTDARVGACKKAVEGVVYGSRNGVTFRQLLNKVGRYDEQTVSSSVRNLWLTGKIKVTNERGENKGAPQGVPMERYVAEKLQAQYDDFDIGPQTKRKGGRDAKGNKKGLKKSLSSTAKEPLS